MCSKILIIHFQVIMTYYIENMLMLKVGLSI